MFRFLPKVLLAICLCLLGTSAASVLFAQEVTLVLERGEGEYRPADSTAWIPLTRDSEVNAGDKVRSSLASSLVLFCKDSENQFFELEVNNEVTIGEQCLTDEYEEPGLIRRLIGDAGAIGTWLFRNPFPSAGSGASRGKPQKTVLVTPRWGNLVQERPHIVWIPGRSAKLPFHLQIWSEDDELVYEDTAVMDSTQTIIPDSVAALAANTFFYVELRSANYKGTKPEAKGQFRVVPQSEIDRLEQQRLLFQEKYDDSMIASLAFVAFLMDEEFYERARLELQSLDQENLLVQRMMAVFYKAIGPREMNF